MLVSAGDASEPMQSMHSDMTQRVRRLSARQPPGNTKSLQCYSCGCDGGMCYVVMKRKSVLRMQKQGRSIKCPIHQNHMHASTYALRFYAVVQELALNNVHGIVWDWFDVPDSGSSNHKMHIDATVLHGETCMRFEIDGETHFSSDGTSRVAIDEEKDDVLRDAGVGILRLHYLDVDIWAQCVLCALQRQDSSVKYTPSYRHCLHPAEYKNILEL